MIGSIGIKQKKGIVRFLEKKGRTSTSERGGVSINEYNHRDVVMRNVGVKTKVVA